MNCFHVWPDYIIGSVLVVYHLCIFEYVLSVASCDTTLNMEPMKLLKEKSAGVSDYIPMVLIGQVDRLLS